MTESITKRMQSFSYAPDLYSDIPSLHEENHSAGAMAGKLSITSAPDVIFPKDEPKQIDNKLSENVAAMPAQEETAQDLFEPKKKKYAKEAWPGKRPGSNFLSV